MKFAAEFLAYLQGLKLHYASYVEYGHRVLAYLQGLKQNPETESDTVKLEFLAYLQGIETPMLGVFISLEPAPVFSVPTRD